MAATSQPAEAHQPTTLIVFYSRSGVSKNVATEVSALLGDHNTVVFEIKDTKVSTLQFKNVYAIKCRAVKDGTDSQ